jgi:hypothetical protein
MVVQPQYIDLEGHLLPPKIRQSLKRDAILNKLSGDMITGFSVILPTFSKELSKCIIQIQPDVDTHAQCCAFDLAGRLGLLPNQSNNIPGLFKTIAIDDLVHNGATYCAPISRHYLVLLISEHMQEVWQVGNRTYASTDIGQFTFYEQEGRSLVHFDGSTRRSTETLIPDQVLEYIQRVAFGEHKGENGTWLKWGFEEYAVVCTPLLRVVHYMRNKDIERWRLLRAFTQSLIDAVEAIFQSIQAPKPFVQALSKDWLVPNSVKDDSSDVERLAAAVQLCVELSGKQVLDLKSRGKSTYCLNHIGYLLNQ